MQYVQLVLTDSQVGLLAAAAGNARLASEDEVEQGQLGALMDFLYIVEAQPERFPVTAPGMRRSIKKRLARAKGPAQPPRPNARKRTQERKIGFQKRTRAFKREQAKLWNEAREAALATLAIEQAEADRERAQAAGIILPGSE